MNVALGIAMVVWAAIYAFIEIEAFIWLWRFDKLQRGKGSLWPLIGIVRFYRVFECTAGVSWAIGLVLTFVVAGSIDGFLLRDETSDFSLIVWFLSCICLGIYVFYVICIYRLRRGYLKLLKER